MRKLFLTLSVLSVILLPVVTVQSQTAVRREATRTQADADYTKIYWSNYSSNAIERANPDGTGRETFAANIASSASPGSFATEVDVPHQKVYFFNQGIDAIERQNFDGSGRETVVSGTGFSYMMVLDVMDSKLYWANFEGGALEQINVDGSGRQALISNIGSTNNGPIAFEVDFRNRKIYWYDPLMNVIKRANLNGSGEETFLTQTGYIYTMSIDKQNQKLYWANFDANTIERVDLSGSGRELVVSGATSSTEFGAGPIAFALDNVNNKIYWHDAGLDAIRRANLNNTGKEVYINNSGFIYSIIIPVENAFSLPVTLQSFSGELMHDAVSLNWKTSKEINAATFDVERSIDNRNFVQLATIRANNKDAIYNYVDKQITGGNNYLYRLKMRDADGQFQYSAVVSVNTALAGRAKEFTVFPNPVFSPNIYLRSNSGFNKAVKIMITDRSGRVVYAETIKNSNGMYTVPSNRLISGSYVLRISDSNDKLLQVLPFIK